MWVFFYGSAGGGTVNGLEILIIAVSLAADAFAVALVRGVELRRFDLKKAFLVGAFFGGFQGLMPLLGWAAARTFEEYITEWDHWIAFALLAFLGARMVFESLTEKDDPFVKPPVPLKAQTLLVSAVATSIDALAVGITFAFLSVDIWQAAGIIAMVTFMLSVLGVYIGGKVGSRAGRGAETAGGLLLIFLGVKILLEHLGVAAI